MGLRARRFKLEELVASDDEADASKRIAQSASVFCPTQIRSSSTPVVKRVKPTPITGRHGSPRLSPPCDLTLFGLYNNLPRYPEAVDNDSVTQREERF